MGAVFLEWETRSSFDRLEPDEKDSARDTHTHTHTQTRARNFRFTTASARASNVTKRIEGLRTKGVGGLKQAKRKIRNRAKRWRWGGIQTDEGAGREGDAEKRRQENSLPGNVWHTFCTFVSL